METADMLLSSHFRRHIQPVNGPFHERPETAVVRRRDQEASAWAKYAHRLTDGKLGCREMFDNFRQQDTVKRPVGERKGFSNRLRTGKAAGRFRPERGFLQTRADERQR